MNDEVGLQAAGDGGTPRRVPDRRVAPRSLVLVMTLALTATLTSGCLVASSSSGKNAVQSVAAEPSTGCHATTPAASGEETLPLAAGGREGTYISEIPTSYRPPVPMPVVFDFHGYSEPAAGQVEVSGLGAYGQEHGFITITPQVTEPVFLWESSIGSEDLAFFGGLLERVEQTLCVDQRRVFVTGYSNGAFMASAVACQFAGQIAAAAPVAGVQYLPGCKPSRPVPIIAFHGTTDPYVHYDGTPSTAAADLPAPDGSGKTLGEEDPVAVKADPTIPMEAADWAKHNGCTSTPTGHTVVPGTNNVTLVDYDCPANANVELYVVAGGGHAWPGSEVSVSIASVIGYTTMAISATALMWEFFSIHPLTSTD